MPTTPTYNFNRIVFLLFLLSLSMMFTPHHAEVGRTVRAGIYNFKPLAYSDTNGAVRGFYVDILNHVTKQESWEVQFWE